MTRFKIATLVVVAAALALVAAAPTQFHNLLSLTHLDTVPYSPPVAGDLIAGNSSGKWDRVPPNTSTTPMVLGMTGDGTNGASPQWVTAGARIVAKQSYIGQVGPIALTTIYTPPVDGFYRLTAFLDISVDPSVTGQVIEFDWTDENGKALFVQVTNNDSINGTSSFGWPAAGGAQMGVIPFVIGGGTAITLHTSSSGGNTSIPYNLHVVLEEL